MRYNTSRTYLISIHEQGAKSRRKRGKKDGWNTKEERSKVARKTNRRRRGREAYIGNEEVDSTFRARVELLRGKLDVLDVLTVDDGTFDVASSDLLLRRDHSNSRPNLVARRDCKEWE